MFLCAFTLLAAACCQDPLPAVDGPFLLPSVLVQNSADTQPKRMGVLIHADGSVEFLPDNVNPNSYPEARIIETEASWVLYPGMVHANFPVTLEKATNLYQGHASDPKQGPIPAMEYGRHAAFLGWMNAADFAPWDGTDGDSWRGFGFTSATLVPQRGLIAGHVSHISLNARPLGEALLQRQGPNVLTLRGVGGYPATPMAALAMLRQVLLDQSQENLSPDLRVGKQVIVRANGARAIENILDLQRDYAPQDSWVILGGHQAWKHAQRIKQQGIRVLYTLDLEEAPKSDEDLHLADAPQRPWWQEPQKLREEKRRLHQQQVDDYLLLKKSGVTCALVPGKKVKDFKDSIQQLLDSPDLAPSDQELYWDLSTRAFEVLGFATPPGNWVLCRAPYSFADPNIAWVFCDGRGWEKDTEKDGTEDEEASADENEGGDVGLAGVWELTVQTPMGDEVFSVDLNPEAKTVEVFRASAPHDRDDATDVKFQGHRVKFGFHIPEPEMDVTVYLKLEDDRMRGKMKTPFGDAPLTGEPADESQIAKSSTKEKKSEEETEDAANSLASGHPEWPVETRMDRFAQSSWAQERKRTVVFRGATLYRMDGSQPAVGDLLILDGIITQIGTEIPVPDGIPEVDVSGWHLMPGIIDAHSHLALDAINEGTVSISAECRIADMIHPESVSIWRAAAGGTAIAQALHGSANPIGGQAATWELDYLATAISDLLVPDAPRNIKFALGENVKQSNWESSWGKRFPNSRVGVQAVYRRAFLAAQDYAEQRRLAADGKLPSFRRDVRLEVLADVLDNTIHVQCHSYRADELLMFLQICKDFGIEAPTFQHVLEGYKVAPEIAAAGAMASTFADWWAYKFEVRDAIPWNVSILDRAGVTVSINSDSDEMIRRLNMEAAKGMLYGGLDWQAAMATCTINSAKQLRIDDRVGSLELGKDGTITIFDGPPLSGYSRCMLTMARGKVLYQAAKELDTRWRNYNTAVRDFVLNGISSSTPAEVRPPLPADEETWNRWTSIGKDSTTLIRGATIHTMVGKPFVGTVLIVDGRITRVVRGERNIEQPRKSHVENIDARGMHLYPGFINGLDRTGIWEYGAVRASRDDIETGQDQPDLSVAAAIHADSEHFPVTRKTGVAYVMVRPESGRIRGQTALIQLDGTTSEDLVVGPDLGLFIRFPHVGSFDQEDGPDVPEDVEELNQWLQDTLDYGQRQDRFAAAGRTDFHRNAKLEASLPYARGEKDIFLYADDAPTLMAARNWAKENALQVVYVGTRDAWKIAGYLGRDRARVILGSPHRLPGSDFDPFDSPFRCASVLDAAGCSLAFATDNPEVTRNLPFQAATMAAWGLGREKALYNLTLGAARLLGVDLFIGSIEKGKVATLILCQGDPLLIEQPVARMWIGGHAVDLNSKQTRLRDRYLERLK